MKGSERNVSARSLEGGGHSFLQMKKKPLTNFHNRERERLRIAHNWWGGKRDGRVGKRGEGGKGMEGGAKGGEMGNWDMERSRRVTDGRRKTQFAFPGVRKR